MSRVKFEFADSFVDEEENIVDYDFKDFVTDFGGLLGLFLGCSTMSLIEVFYHPIKYLWERLNKCKNSRVLGEISNDNIEPCEVPIINLRMVEELPRDIQVIIKQGEFRGEIKQEDKKVEIDLDRLFG